MELSIVPPYAALFGIGMILLSAPVIRLRATAGVNIGSGGHPALERAIRVQGNYGEYVPLTLLLLAFAEIGGSPDWLIHGLCGLLLVGRVLHALGVSRTEEDTRFRVFGMVATFAVLGVVSIVLLTGGSLLTAVMG